jgi:hypothetical protein
MDLKWSCGQIAVDIKCPCGHNVIDLKRQCDQNLWIEKAVSPLRSYQRLFLSSNIL